MQKPTTAALVIRIIAGAFALALFFEATGARQLLHLDPSVGLMTPIYWVSLLAPIFFLSALWSSSNIFARADRGEPFDPTMVCGLKNIGANLTFGAFAAIVVQPSLIFLINNGFTEMRGVRFDLSAETITIAAIGFVLILLARQGQQLKTKLDEFV